MVKTVHQEDQDYREMMLLIVIVHLGAMALLWRKVKRRSLDIVEDVFINIF
ncbi:unnamed protein product [Strongylus vulgaris]|uniref:Uncharacterized protein n=1 Tax=Strongylus vulgaris TaxID=40348 RepID=A0A3P7L4C0_STRVU|nr:unnamed protein product [Strongylus vulgaris]